MGVQILKNECFINARFREIEEIGSIKPDQILLFQNTYYHMFTPQDYTKVVNNYIYNTSHILGEGSSSVVYLGSSLLTNDPVAIRVISLRTLVPESLVNINNEMAVLNYLPPHPNVIRVYDILQTKNHAYVVTELCDSKLDVNMHQDVTAIASGIIQGVRHLIAHNVVHRDIKTQNIMLKNGVPKIIDFGFSRFISDHQEVLGECLGTPYYMPPQMLEQRAHTSKCDMWSLGVTLYELLYKTLPFQATQLSQLLWMTKSTIPQYLPGYNDLLTTIIQGCLVADETYRLSWQQLFALSSKLRTSPIPSLKENRGWTSAKKGSIPTKRQTKGLGHDITNLYSQ